MADAIDPVRVLDEAIAALNQPDAILPAEAVERALKVAPLDARLWHVKGLIHRVYDRRELAIPALQRAASLAPTEGIIAHGLARTMLEAGLPSVDAFALAARLNGFNGDILKGLAAALVAEGQSATAMEGLEKAVERSPVWVDGHSLLASLRWSHGERDGFARSFDDALHENPTNADLWLVLIVTLLNAERFDDALARIDAARRAMGEHEVFDGHEVNARVELGQVDEADRLFAKLAPLQLPNVELRRVRHALRQGRLDVALKTLDRWLSSDQQAGFWPYAATAWRLANDTRSDWLEGDRRLVGVFDIGDRLPPMDELAGKLRAIHNLDGQPLAQSVRGGTQTDGHLFQRIDPVIVSLREATRRTIGEYVAQLPEADPAHPLLRSVPADIKFSGAWSVRLQAGGHHSNHVHPMGWVSSALYIALPPDLGDDHSGWLTLGEPQAELALDLAPTRLVEPKSARLALFPSWMWHGTRPFGSGERLTVAFDVTSPGQRPRQQQNPPLRRLAHAKRT